MNPQTEVKALETVVAAIDPPSLALDASKQERRSHGKIAQLSKIWRDRINSMLDDGVAYRAIVARLQQSTDPPLPYPICEMDISRWKNGGYQRYLAQQERFAYVTQSREAAQEMAAADTTTLPEGALQIIFAHRLGQKRAGSRKDRLFQRFPVIHGSPSPANGPSAEADLRYLPTGTT